MRRARMQPDASRGRRQAKERRNAVRERADDLHLVNSPDGWRHGFGGSRIGCAMGWLIVPVHVFTPVRYRPNHHTIACNLVRTREDR